jgi:hypothetical protein
MFVEAEQGIAAIDEPVEEFTYEYCDGENCDE